MSDYMIASQLGVMLIGAPTGNTPSISRPRGSSADYNGNNTWYFNGNNGCFNNNNRYNGNFRSRPVLDFDWLENFDLDNCLVPLSEWLIISLLSARGKNGKPTYVHFRLHRIDRLISITHQVNWCEMMPTMSTAHIIFEPRVREIVCAVADKRAVQTFYISTLQPYLEQYMYHRDSYSCRPGKGSLRAIQQLHEYVYEATNGYTTDCWLAKVDLQAFFMSLDCFRLCDTVTQFIEKYMDGSPLLDIMRYLTRQIYLSATKDHLRDMAQPSERAMLDPRKSLYNQPYYRGVPIGDWTSQTGGLIATTGALLYLASLGYHFVHYTDDTTIVVTDREMWLKENLWRLEQYYKAQGLTLHPQKRYFQHYSKGVEMLGYKLCYDRVLPSDRIMHNALWYVERTARRADKDFSRVLACKDKVLSSVNSYLGLLKHLSAYRLRRMICEQIEASPLGKIFDVAEDYTKITIRREYSDETYFRKAYRTVKKRYVLAA